MRSYTLFLSFKIPDMRLEIHLGSILAKKVPALQPLDMTPEQLGHEVAYFALTRDQPHPNRPAVNLAPLAMDIAHLDKILEAADRHFCPDNNCRLSVSRKGLSILFRLHQYLIVMACFAITFCGNTELAEQNG